MSIKKAVAGCDGVLTVLVPWGVHQYSSGTAQAVLDHSRPGARLIFSCGRHITRDVQDVYSRRFKALAKAAGLLGRLVRAVGIDDQVGSVPSGVHQRDTVDGRAWAISRRGRARVYRCGADTWVTPSLRAT
jgi:hypothetical protein